MLAGLLAFFLSFLFTPSGTENTQNNKFQDLHQTEHAPIPTVGGADWTHGY